CMNRFNRNERAEGESRRPSAKGASSAARPEGGNASPPAGPASA
ncbi:MAG: hypothetical protein RLZZ565_381, partial [Planctomycetota bacterium]